MPPKLCPDNDQISAVGGSASRIICRSNSNTIVLFVKVKVIVSLLVVAQLIVILFLPIVELIVMVGGASTPALRCCQLNHVKTEQIRSK